MPDISFVVTITAKDYETAHEELVGALEDARDSQIIKDFSVVDGAEQLAPCPVCR